MNKNLLHSLAILGLVFFVGKCELLTAQSGDVKRTGTELPGVHLGLALANSRADSRQASEPHPNPVAEGPAKTKVYKFRSIDYPGADESEVYDFNGKTAVGQFYQGASAFTFEGTSYMTLNIPGSLNSLAAGINTSDEIVGTYFDGQVHGFLYDGKNLVTIDVPGATETEAQAINDAGLIVGVYYDSKGEHGFSLDRNGNFSDINFPGTTATYATGVNASGEITGFYYDSQVKAHGFLLSNGMYSSIDFPGATQTFAYGINDAGMIAGNYGGGANQGFIHAGGVFTTVDVPGADYTFLLRIKNNRNVVGYLIDSLGEYHGFIGK